MKLSLNVFFNFFLLALTMMLLCAFQTSFWYQLFGTVPGPLLWINLLIYIALYRRPFLAIWLIYALGALAIAFTFMPLKMMLLSLLILFTIIYAIKSRFFWPGSGYYTLMCFIGAIAFHIIYFSISFMFEHNHTAVQPFERFVQIMLTPSFAFPMYWLLARLDRWTRCEMLQESGGVEL